MKIPFFKKKIISKSFNPFDNFEKNQTKGIIDQNPVFVTGVGRSGSHFLSSLYSQNKNIDAFHLDEIGNPTADSFLFYCNWYNLPVDYTGFFSSRDHLIQTSSIQNRRLLESNPYLALFTKELGNYYSHGKIIVLLRNPRKVVLSHYNKGWYTDYEPSFSKWGSAPFYQYEIARPNHFFGRFFPNEKNEFEVWTQLSQIGKIAWMWQSVNNKIKESISSLTPEQIRVIDIDHFDYEEYTSLNRFLNLQNDLSNEEFDKLVKMAPGHTVNKVFDTWGELEELEFQTQIKKFTGF